MGLKEQIKSLNSQEEIYSLLNKGLSNYEYASKQTKNSWKNAAKIRIEQIMSGKVTTENTVKNKSKTKQPTKRKKSTKLVDRKRVKQTKK